MKTHYSFLCAALLLISTSSFAQKIKWETGGDLAFLKGQQSLATGYDYSNVTVKGESQEAYVAAQKGELNKDKAGEGDVFETEWTSARAQKYQPAFEKLMNKRLESDGIVVKAENGAKYKVVLVTGDMQLGKGKMFVKKPALVNFTIMIVEAANPGNVLAKGILEEVAGEVNAPKGSGWIPGGAGTAMSVTANVQNRDYTNRIAKSYEKAGEILAKAIHKVL
jgi:hypothetical protein